ncbi:SDR family oxidoreductase [Mucilaginibacter conchicola]|uniref:SDR family oxidoreductase n=1 Tax=Mucilaginibacter conchicola TaxID=2303333 RepID=A0A372NQH9_9SPHI|nr:SDR family oxidoreductase [Mucilaginibacter conchicola]RFZ91194.1 SDR family oxidoreductase [Mucilaginibacter conchicola]
MKILITGGSSGIGKGLAEKFYEKGWDVLVTGRDAVKLTLLENELKGIRTMVYDSSLPDDEISVISFIKNEWGNELDILVNNAGHVALTPFENLERETLENMYRVHLTAPSMLTAGCIDALKKTRGQIINITSSHGIKPYPQLMAYGSAKSGLNMLTKIWALELAPFYIRVNAIAPGPTETPVLSNAGSPKRS